MSAYSYETIRSDRPGVPPQYRVRDSQDNRVATCYQEENARHVVAALNGTEKGLWSCGHVSVAACAECFEELAAKAHDMANALDDASKLDRDLQLASKIHCVLIGVMGRIKRLAAQAAPPNVLQIIGQHCDDAIRDLTALSAVSAVSAKVAPPAYSDKGNT